MTLLNDFDRAAFVATPVSRPRFSQWFAAVIAALRVRAEIARIARFHQSRGSPPIPPHLRRDLGLPEFRDEPWRGYHNW